MELFDILKVRTGIPVNDPMDVLFARNKTPSDYGETKVTVIMHVDPRSEAAHEEKPEYFDTILEAAQYVLREQSMYWYDTDRCTTLIIGSKSGITKIDDRVFSGTRNSHSGATIKEVVIPNCVTSIGEEAFGTSDSLWKDYVNFIEKADLPDSIVEIGKNAFYNCFRYLLSSFPKNVKSIGEYAFYKCEGITADLDLSNVKTLGVYAFSECKKIKSVILPTIETISDYAFYKCSALQNVIIPEGIKTIGKYALASCGSLKDIQLPETITTIGKGAFSSTGITCISIPDGVTKLNTYTFAGCEYLSAVILPSTLVEIGDREFRNCTSLKSITIPSSVMSIDKNAFYDCSNITITIDKPRDSIPNSPWGAKNATVIWNG